LLAFPRIVVDESKLFPGSDQKSRFGACLHRMMKLHKSLYHNKCSDPDELGTHSIRKGAATYCCAGVHPGPPIVSVCLRAGWTIGRVKERYLKYENAGDELVGRTLTGIPPTSCDFGVSPVYFVQNSEHTNQINELFRLTFPLHGNKVVSLCRSLLACFIHHEDFTSANTPQESPIMFSSYYSTHAVFENRSAFVKTSLPWENEMDCPVLTGIPIHCSLLNKLMEVHAMQKALADEILAKFVNELDERSMDAGTFNANCII